MVQNYDELFFVSLLYKQLSNTKLLKSETPSERIAIIEFDSSHDECLLTQINALRTRGSMIILITNQEIRSRNPHLEPLVDEWKEIDPKGRQIRGAAIGDARIIWRLMRSLKEQKIDKVIFNTGQGGHVRNACLFSLFNKIEFIGIVHTIRKFQGSFTQRIINLKIKKYFVLAEFLKESVTPLSGLKSRFSIMPDRVGMRLYNEPRRSASKGSRSRRIKRRNSKLQLESFYALDFPRTTLHHEKNDQVNISIIGSVEARRKDLEGFVSLVQQTDQSVYFHFLGKADPTSKGVVQLKEDLEKIGCMKRVEFFDNRLEFEKINQILRKTCAILPLIHPNTPSAEEYFRNQIPGGMNIALGYKIPLLLHESFQRIKELQSAALYYSLEDFSGTVNTLKSSGKSIHEMMNQTDQYSSSFQHKKYLDFIFD